MQVVRDDGAMLPCALNATCAALVDAGILLRSMFGMIGDTHFVSLCVILLMLLNNCAIIVAAAVSVTMTKSGEFLLDPTQHEEQVKLLLVSSTCCCVLIGTALKAIVNVYRMSVS